jgi:hypothetical protein
MPTLNITYQDKKHLQRVLSQEQQVNALFNHFIRLLSPEMRKWKDPGKSGSVWIRNATVENRIDRYLNEFQRSLEKMITQNQKEAWMDAITKNDVIVEQYIKNMAISSTVKSGLFKRNLEGLTALQKRVDDGMNLSQRVWNITEQTKGHVEFFLESGIAQGRSAEAIGRDFRQLLNNPDKRFRRVRNNEGKLMLSQPMKDYHPGRGVYRSSRMNALRVASTETNMGYRMSDAERWEQLDFILGYEVRRSANAHPCPICDSLKGQYPKEFIFPGWHPFCICYAVPIVMEHDDFADFLLHEDIPKNKIITDIPQRSRSWISDYMQKAGKPPIFVKQNVSWFNKDRDT